MHHIPGNIPLSGALRGTLPSPTLFHEDNSLVLAEQVFGPRRWSPFSLIGQATSAPAASVSMDEVRAFDRRYLVPEEVQAGSNITIVKNARGPVISAAAAGFVGVGTPVLDLVESKDFSVAGTSYSFAGLNGNTDEIYILEYHIIKDTALPMKVTVQPNGITTNQSTYERYDGTSSGSVNYTDLRIADSGAGAVGDVHAGRFQLHSKTGAHRVGQSLWSEVAAGTFILAATLVWRELVTNIVSLNIVSDVASGIGPGSFLRLYKLRKTVSASGNFVETTLALDGNLVFTATVIGQAWVTASSKLTASLFAVASGGTTEEMIMASGVVVGCKNRVAGVGFDVWAYNPNGMVGTITIHITGS